MGGVGWIALGVDGVGWMWLIGLDMIGAGVDWAAVVCCFVCLLMVAVHRYGVDNRVCMDTTLGCGECG